MNSIDEILAGYDGLQAAQEAFYKDLHQHPELSHQEQRTAGRVAAQLRRYGAAVYDGIGGTGVVGMLSNGDGPVVLLRADMDALPVKEDTGADYASTATARDADGSEVPVAHACGHDIHVACLLGMTKLMADQPGRWNGTLLALFQPEGVWAIPHLGLELAGQAAIRATLSGFFGEMDYVVQMNAPATIDVTGDSALAHSNIREAGKTRGKDEGFEFFGLYEDRLARTPDGWKFARRTFIHMGTHYFPLLPPR